MRHRSFHGATRPMPIRTADRTRFWVFCAGPGGRHFESGSYKTCLLKNFQINSFAFSRSDG
jgi:hypothetical protein